MFVLHDVNAAAGVASHVLSLFRGSTHRAGPAADQLERVYGCPFQAAVADGRRFYLAR